MNEGDLSGVVPSASQDTAKGAKDGAKTGDGKQQASSSTAPMSMAKAQGGETLFVSGQAPGSSLFRGSQGTGKEGELVNSQDSTTVAKSSGSIEITANADSKEQTQTPGQSTTSSTSTSTSTSAQF